MNMERPPLPASQTPPSEPKKRSVLDRMFRYLPAGSRRVAGAMALGAMEMMSDGKGTEQTEALSQANDIVQEQKKEKQRRDMEAEEATVQSEKLDEIRKKIGSSR